MTARMYKFRKENGCLVIESYTDSLITEWIEEIGDIVSIPVYMNGRKSRKKFNTVRIVMHDRTDCGVYLIEHKRITPYVIKFFIEGPTCYGRHRSERFHPYWEDLHDSTLLDDIVVVPHYWHYIGERPHKVTKHFRAYSKDYYEANKDKILRESDESLKIAEESVRKCVNSEASKSEPFCPVLVPVLGVKYGK